MTHDDRVRFATAISGMAALFKEAMTEEQIGLYFHALRDLPIEEVVHAMDEAMATEEFFPRPATLRRWCRAAGALPGYEPGAGLLPPPPPEPPNPTLRALPGPPPVECGPSRSEALAEVLDRVMPGLRAQARRVQAERTRPMTPEEIAARKAELRDQAKLVTGGR